MYNVEIKKGDKGKYLFIVKSRNGRTVISGGPADTPELAQAAAKKIQELIKGPEKITLIGDGTNNSFYLVYDLEGNSSKVMAVSPIYARRTARNTAIAKLQKFAFLFHFKTYEHEPSTAQPVRV